MNRDLDHKNEDSLEDVLKREDQKSLRNMIIVLAVTVASLFVVYNARVMEKEKSLQYCLTMGEKYGEQILSEIYTPGEKETCSNFLENYSGK